MEKRICLYDGFTSTDLLDLRRLLQLLRYKPEEVKKFCDDVLEGRVQDPKERLIEYYEHELRRLRNPQEKYFSKPSQTTEA